MKVIGSNATSLTSYWRNSWCTFQ